MTTRPDALYVIFIAAPIDRIWETLISPSSSRSFFFGNSLVIGEAVGEPFEVLGLDQKAHVRGEVLAREDGRRLRVSWAILALPDLPVSQFEFLLEESGEIVRLTVAQFNGGPVPQGFVDASRDGWALTLPSLKTLMETGAPLPSADPRAPS